MISKREKDKELGERIEEGNREKIKGERKWNKREEEDSGDLCMKRGEREEKNIRKRA